EPLAETAKDDPGGAGVSLFGQIIKDGAVCFEFLEVGLQKVNVQVIQGIKITVQKLGRDFIIEGLPKIMGAFENSGRDLGDIPIVRALDQRDGVGQLPGDEEEI